VKEVKLSAFAPSAIAGSGDFKLPKITEFENKDIVITGVRFGEGNFGEYAVITLKDGNECRSGNQVILKQLHAMAENFDGETVAQVKVMRPKGKQYYVLADPDPGK